MIKNPSIDELHNSDVYKLVAEPSHLKIKEFLLEQIQERPRLIRIYLIYQFAMICLGLLFFGLSVIRAIKVGEFEYLFYSLAALVFAFSLLIVLHELIHGLAFKLVGVSKVTYGAILKQFIFYAEADRHVLNRRQFRIVALAPLVVVKVVSLAGIIVFFHHPAAWFFVVQMSLHSLFCAGDVGILSLFYKYDEEVYTYDLRSEKKSFFFVKRNEANN